MLCCIAYNTHIHVNTYVPSPRFYLYSMNESLATT